MDGDDLAVPAGFELVADETRARILYALSREMRDAPADPALGFSELRKRVGVRDSGNFNYHLDKLLGSFVERTGEGYALTYPGMAVVSALVGGEYEATGELGPEPYGEPCPVCEEPLAVTYRDGLLRLRCEAGDDEYHSMTYSLPRHAVDRDDLPAAADLMVERAHAELSLLVDGRCPMCFGETAVEVADTPRAELSPGFDVTCTRCGMPYQLLVGHAVVNHPDVVAFYADRGVDVRSAPLEMLRLARGDAVTRVGDDPPRFEVTVERDGEALRAVVDADATVRTTERV